MRHFLISFYKDNGPDVHNVSIELLEFPSFPSVLTVESAVAKINKGRPFSEHIKGKVATIVPISEQDAKEFLS